ncbi:MAG: hypothetical protein ACR2GW_13270 [Pyrinomonadaceae bacterium]
MANTKRTERAGDHGGSALTWRDGRNSTPKLTVARARELVRLILAQDDDEQARALVELVSGIGYEPDNIDRDGLALWAIHEAYSLTSECSEAVERFATVAATHVSEAERA